MILERRWGQDDLDHNLIRNSDGGLRGWFYASSDKYIMRVIMKATHKCMLNKTSLLIFQIFSSCWILCSCMMCPLQAVVRKPRAARWICIVVAWFPRKYGKHWTSCKEVLNDNQTRTKHWEAGAYWAARQTSKDGINDPRPKRMALRSMATWRCRCKMEGGNSGLILQITKATQLQANPTCLWGKEVRWDHSSDQHH